MVTCITFDNVFTSMIGSSLFIGRPIFKNSNYVIMSLIEVTEGGMVEGKRFYHFHIETFKLSSIGSKDCLGVALDHGWFMGD